MDLVKKEIAVKASILYYEKHKNQAQIAKELGISRSYVSHLLDFARNNDIVEIKVKIDHFDLRMIRKEMEFCEKYSTLQQCYVMKSDSDDFTNRQIGIFAAPYISNMINKASVIGISLGNSVMNLINGIKGQKFINTFDKTVVQTVGGIPSSVLITTHPNIMAHQLSGILGCNFVPIDSPGIVEDPLLKKGLLNDKNIQSSFLIWEKIDLLLTGISVADRRNTLFQTLSDSMIKMIEKSNACGVIDLNFFNREGDYIPLLENNKISIPISKLRRIKQKVVIGYGKYKNEAILGALKGGLIDILITDSITIDEIERIGG
jgi:deoxyribonucleoside regulator